MSEIAPNPHGYFPQESRPAKPRELVPQPVDHAQRVVGRWSWFKRYRWIAFFCVAALLCVWALDRVYFEYRFGPFFPSGAYGSTEVVSRSWGPPRGVPKTYSRRVREALGCYYPGHAARWDPPHKTLKDTLEEYGADVRNSKLCEASGREIRIMKKSSLAVPGWDSRFRQLIKKDCTVLIVDIAETDDDEKEGKGDAAAP